MALIHKPKLERQLLAGLLKFPDKYYDLARFIGDEDFTSSSLKKIFYHLSQSIEKGERLDATTLTAKLEEESVCFLDEKMDAYDFVSNLYDSQVNEVLIDQYAKDLKTFTVRRQYYNSALNTAEQMKSLKNCSIEEIISVADKAHNNQISYIEGNAGPENIYEDIKELIEDLGNNPVGEIGYVGPHKRLHELFGSLLRPGDITVIVARSGVGKTKFCMDFCTKVSAQYNDIPILHFDNGEMSKRDLMFRQMSALTGIPPYYFETGKWRSIEYGGMSSEQVQKSVRKWWPKLEKMKFFYYNVANHTTEEQLNLLQKFYYSEVGRGNPMIFSYDYIKSPIEGRGSNSQWQEVGTMIQKYKTFIQAELLHHGEPVIPMITSVQANRGGIVGNRNSADLDDDTGQVGLSDMITQQCSHMFLLREKTLDEMERETDFGTHKLKPLKNRFLGKNASRATERVLMPNNRQRRNEINLEINGFSVVEKGDLVDFTNSDRTDTVEPLEGGAEDNLGLPEGI